MPEKEEEIELEVDGKMMLVRVTRVIHHARKVVNSSGRPGRATLASQGNAPEYAAKIWVEYSVNDGQSILTKEIIERPEGFKR